MWLKVKGGLFIRPTQIVFLKGYKISTHKGDTYDVWARLSNKKVVLLASFKNEENAKKFFNRISKKIGG